MATDIYIDANLKKPDGSDPGLVNWGQCSKFVYVAIGILLLPLALLAALDYSPHVDNAQTMQWFFNYEHGFIQRGLLGHMISLFHDAPNLEIIRPLVVDMEKAVIAISLSIFWALLIPVGIWRLDLSDPNKLALTAFAAVLLLAPIWKVFGHIAGFGDEWTFFFILVALGCFIGRRPVLYAVFVVLSYMNHPQGLLYGLLLSVLVGHAIIRLPAYAQRWRIWGAAAAAPFVVMAILFSIVSLEAVKIIFDRYSEEFLKATSQAGVDAWLIELAGQSEAVFLRMMTEMQENPFFFVKIFIVSSVPVLVCAVLFCWALTRLVKPAASGFVIKTPLPGVVAWVVAWEFYIIAIGASLFSLPMILVGTDMGRFLHLGWLGLAIAAIYLLWFVKNSSLSQNAANHSGGPSRLPRPVVTLMAVWAFVNAGASPIVFSQLQDGCNLCQDTTYLLNKNPLADKYSRFLYDFMADKNKRLHFDSQEIANFQGQIGNEKGEYWLEDGKLVFSKQLLGKEIFEKYVVAQGGQSIVAELNYEGEVKPPVEMRIFHYNIDPDHVDENRVVWKFQAAEESMLLRFAPVSVSGQEFKVVGFSINIGSQ